MRSTLQGKAKRGEIGSSAGGLFPVMLFKLRHKTKIHTHTHTHTHMLVATGEL